MKKILACVLMILCCSVPAFAQLGNEGGFSNGSGGGAATNVASPGPIGGTTSSTGQFTNVAIGASVPALDGTIGDISISGALQLPTASTADCFASTTFAICTASGRMSLQVGTGNKLSFDTPSVEVANINAAGVNVLTGGLSILNGRVLNSTGGAVPTATCSGGSTGVVVSAGNSSCTASVTPFPCCTGSGTGTCSQATNNRGLILTSSLASTNCTITWSAAGTWPQSPGCQFTDGSASITPTVFAEGNCGTSTCVFDFASATSKVVQWMCM